MFDYQLNLTPQHNTTVLIWNCSLNDRSLNLSVSNFFNRLEKKKKATLECIISDVELRRKILWIIKGTQSQIDLTHHAWVRSFNSFSWKLHIQTKRFTLRQKETHRKYKDIDIFTPFFFFFPFLFIQEQKECQSGFWTRELASFFFRWRENKMSNMFLNADSFHG